MGKASNPSKPLERVILKALAFEPKERYQSAADFATDLQIASSIVANADDSMATVLSVASLAASTDNAVVDLKTG